MSSKVRDEEPSPKQQVDTDTTAVTACHALREASVVVALSKVATQLEELYLLSKTLNSGVQDVDWKDVKSKVADKQRRRETTLLRARMAALSDMDMFSNLSWSEWMWDFRQRSITPPSLIVNDAKRRLRDHFRQPFARLSKDSISPAPTPTPAATRAVASALSGGLESAATVRRTPEENAVLRQYLITFALYASLPGLVAAHLVSGLAPHVALRGRLCAAGVAFAGGAYFGAGRPKAASAITVAVRDLSRLDTPLGRACAAAIKDPALQSAP